MTMNTEYDTRADSRSDPYDAFPELTFPSGLRLADLYDLVCERPKDDFSGVADHAAPGTGSSPAVS
jgi:hypothetical protein